jgi:lysophospholipase L1-like esterase
MHLFFIGDSFVNGTGDPDYLGWTGRVCQAGYQQGWKITAYNLGVRRETSAEIKQRWLHEVTEFIFLIWISLHRSIFQQHGDRKP